MLSTVYGYVPCGSQPAKALADPNNVAIPPSYTYLTSTEALTKAMEKMWEMDRLPMDDSPSSLTKEELIVVSKIKDTLSFHKGLKMVHHRAAVESVSRPGQQLRECT